MISSTGVLQILPGVTVFLGPHITILNFGAIIAVGTPATPIIFTNSSVTQWTAIKLLGGMSTFQYGSSRAIFYIVVQFSNGGLGDTAMVLQETAATIQYCSFSYSVTTALYMYPFPLRYVCLVIGMEMLEA